MYDENLCSLSYFHLPWHHSSHFHCIHLLLCRVDIWIEPIEEGVEFIDEIRPIFSCHIREELLQSRIDDIYCPSIVLLEFHKTLENYYNAKLNLARRCTGVTFIYRDNVLASAMEKDNTVFLDHPVIANAEEDRLFFSENGKMYIFPHPEDFALDNAFLAAAAVRNETGLSEDEILSHMKELENPEGRCETLLIGSRIIVIDFAHTPDAFSALFSSFRRIYPSKGFITVFGASGCRDATKRPHMGHEAAKASRAVIITEDDPREEGFQKISRDILSGIKDTQAEVFIIEKRDDALRKAFQISDENDIIFSLGLGAQKSIDYHTHRRSWSEREEIMKAAKEVLV